jgi:hypothetical protein
MRHRPLALALCLALASIGAQAHDDDRDDHGDISHVNGSISADAGQQYGDLDTVNGGISVEKGASAGKVETVNGGISLEDDVQVKSLETVNGGIVAGRNTRIADGADTVNGGIRITFHSHVGGDVGTVNGGITIQQTEVGGKLHTVNGDITVGADSIVHGGILVEKPNHSGWNWSFGWGKPKIPRIVIGPHAVVEGELRFEREVELYVHTTAKIGKVTGATVHNFTDTVPARD